MTDPPARASSALDLFGASTRAWFEAQFEAPTRVQSEGWPAIASRRNALMLAPTGSGKTLAAFLWCIDRLIRADGDEAPGVRVVYVSPLKALVYDVERNLRAPLAGVHEAANACGEALRLPRVAVRTGDTSARERRAQARSPAEILVTTPESLYLILGSQQRSTLERVHTVIVDEIHALAPTKRGAHLSLSLERLCALTASDPQRTGPSRSSTRPIALGSISASWCLSPTWSIRKLRRRLSSRLRVPHRGGKVPSSAGTTWSPKRGCGRRSSPACSTRFAPTAARCCSSTAAACVSG